MEKIRINNKILINSLLTDDLSYNSMVYVTTVWVYDKELLYTNEEKMDCV
ncbi:hypothetical protein XA3_05690 [Xylocopilactobacillus apicola]|uniref:Uncharacterized protein n=1 Tax=Xylocopilactobacillus apicola TaxID=2932184 RepID=A0AAU9DW13_9LACO|nr:hypothetical protein XA3_05690 [Xylocopilactobacillus apicola]